MGTKLRLTSLCGDRNLRRWNTYINRRLVKITARLARLRRYLVGETSIAWSAGPKWRYEIATTWESSAPLPRAVEIDRFRRLVGPSKDLPDHVTRIMQLLHDVPADWSSILDFGCGGGEYGLLMKRDGLLDNRLYVGAEVNWDLVSYFQNEATPVGPFVTIPSGGALPFRSSSFDVVLASGVLQYVTDWRGCLREIARICDGHVIAARVPVIGLSNSLVARQVVEHEGATAVTYLNLFSKSEFADALVSNGFSVLKTTSGPESVILQERDIRIRSENFVLSVS